MKNSQDFLQNSSLSNDGSHTAYSASQEESQQNSDPVGRNNKSNQSTQYDFRQKQSRSIPVLLSIEKASKISGLGRNNLAYLIKHHKLPVVKLPGYNRIKIHYDDLIDFIENNKCIYTTSSKHSSKKIK